MMEHQASKPMPRWTTRYCSARVATISPFDVAKGCILSDTVSFVWLDLGAHWMRRPQSSPSFYNVSSSIIKFLLSLNFLKSLPLTLTGFASDRSKHEIIF